MGKQMIAHTNTLLRSLLSANTWLGGSKSVRQHTAAECALPAGATNTGRDARRPASAELGALLSPVGATAGLGRPVASLRRSLTHSGRLRALRRETGQLDRPTSLLAQNQLQPPLAQIVCERERGN